MSDRSWAALLALVFATGLALRLLGITWGLPARLEPSEPPFHPDEHEPVFGAVVLYGQPPPATFENPQDLAKQRAEAFKKGGALYMRLAWGVSAAVRAHVGLPPEQPYAPLRTILGLRLLNVAFALATAALVAWIGLRLAGRAVGLGAGALLLCFPNHVLDSHYARPDVLVTLLSTAALACAFRVAREGGARALALGGLFAGLASATMLSGLAAFAPLAVGALEWQRRQAGAHWLRGWVGSARWALLGALFGYALGNAEALLHWEAFRGGLELAASTHHGGRYALPTRLVLWVSLYAFGSVAAVAAWAGAALMLVRGTPGSWTLVSALLVGYALLGRVGGDMMRHLEIVAPASAVAAALALVAAAGPLSRLGLRPPAARATALGAGVAATLQLSLAYVWPMQFDEDPRYRAGRWLVAHAPPGASVGRTVSYYGDRTYAPRIPPPHRLEVRELMLRRNFDASAYLDLGLDYIATSDYPRSHAGGPTAPAFVRELFRGARYRAVAAEGPRWQPLCLPDLLRGRRPSDLLYVRAVFYVFERTG